MTWYPVVVFILALGCIQASDGANILGLMGCASPSHHIWNEIIFEELAARGHHLTIISMDKSDKHHNNIRYIHLEETYTAINAHFWKNDSDFSKTFPGSNWQNLMAFHEYHLVTCSGVIKSKGFKVGLREVEAMDVDLVLYDVANGPCLIRFLEKAGNVPVIGVNPYKSFPELFDMIGGHAYPSYIPYTTAAFSAKMNFWERLQNTALYVATYFYKNFVVYPVIDEKLKPFFEGQESLHDLEKRLKMILIGIHPAIDYVESLPPNVVQVAGLHIKEPKPLPTDIAEFIEGSTKGAVLISLGTNMKTELLGAHRLEAIIETIASLPEYRFLWKLSSSIVLKNHPKNLLVRDWFPQNDVLAHPKLRGFFTHAGSLSIQEATWYGVPIVAMPLFLDQNANALRAVSRGFGKKVDYQTLNGKSLLTALQEILLNPVYSDNMKASSVALRDQQNKPLDTAIWWIEYFLRNPTAEHLTSPSRDLGMFVSRSLDVLLLVAIIVIIFFVNTIIVLRRLLSSSGAAKAKANTGAKKGAKLKKK